MTTSLTLTQLGWHPYFQQQMSEHEYLRCIPARVFNCDRSSVTVQHANGRQLLPRTPCLPELTVGDWLLLDEHLHFSRLLIRLSLFSRKAAGTQLQRQLIAANVDTLCILSSLNQEFNLNRIERYIALARDAHVDAVIVLTKADNCGNADEYAAQIRRIDSMLPLLVINCLDAACISSLQPWLGPGKTIALMGSSGVGKSTLANTLLGQQLQSTSAIREDDDKGRHTTTRRSLHVLPAGGLLLDTPGMRELQLADCEEGIESTFPEITALALQCRFDDCQHDNEPHCAVRQAIDAGTLDQRRLINFLKLLREQAFNGATLAEQRAHARKLGRMHRPAKFTHARKRSTLDD